MEVPMARLMESRHPLLLVVGCAALLGVVACENKDTGKTDDTGETEDSGQDTEETDTVDDTPVWDSLRIETSTTLSGVHVSGDGSTYVVGTTGHMWKYSTDLGWSAVPVEVEDEDLNGIWGPAGSPGWVAVGNAGWVVQFNGAQADIVDLGTSSFIDVHGSSMSNLYAVSWGGPWHFDGSSWSRELVQGSDQLNAVFATENTAFAVGEAGAIEMRIAGEWRVVEVSTNKDLNDVHGTGDNNVWAVGEEGVIVHFDGKSWTVVESPTTYSLYGVWAAAPNAVYVVGVNGIAWLYDGSTWSRLYTGVANMLYGISGTSATDVWAVGNKGTVLRYSGS
jgi:hypothetical protein